MFLALAITAVTATACGANETPHGRGGAVTVNGPRLTSSTIVPGVVVEPGRGIVYVMRPGGGIEALDVGDGRLQWASSRADQPLFVSGNALFAMIETAAGALAAAKLDPANGLPPAKAGEPLVLPLPAGVTAGIDRSLEHDFTLAVGTVADEIHLTWEFRVRTVTGFASPDASSSERRETGVFRFLGDSFEAISPESMIALAETWPAEVEALSEAIRKQPLRAGNVIAIAEQRYGPDQLVLRRWRAGDGEPLEEQLLYVGRALAVLGSCDERHVVVAIANPEGAAARPYVLRYVEIASAALLAELPSSRSAGPFCIAGTRLLRLSQPERRRVDGTMVATPLEIAAFDLGSGELAWRRPVRDTAFRGAPPPRN